MILWFKNYLVLLLSTSSGTTAAIRAVAPKCGVPQNKSATALHHIVLNCVNWQIQCGPKKRTVFRPFVTPVCVDIE